MKFVHQKMIMCRFCSSIPNAGASESVLVSANDVLSKCRCITKGWGSLNDLTKSTTLLKDSEIPTVSDGLLLKASTASSDKVTSLFLCFKSIAGHLLTNRLSIWVPNNKVKVFTVRI